MHGKMPIHAAAVLILAIAAGGCSGLALPPVEEILPEQPKPKAEHEPVPVAPGRVVGSPTEVYTRLARGILTCWFGAEGPLKKDYIYHAKAEPASKGGSSRIRIMTRDHEADDPRALRAYMASISPGGGITKVEVENRRLPAPLADGLKKDIERWTTGEDGCGEGPVTAGWTADPTETDKNSKENQ